MELEGLQIAAAMHHFLDHLVHILMVGLEILGAVVIAYGAIVIFVRFLTLKYATPCTDMRIRFARTISLGLEFYLAAEIFKTVMIKEPADLISVAVIVVLRTVMAVVVHWEMKHDMETLKEEQELEHAQEHQQKSKPALDHGPVSLS